jgi:hypothetical protein
LALGPAAWKFGWARDDWDRLAAGIVAYDGQFHMIGDIAAVEKLPKLAFNGVRKQYRSGW